MMRGDYVSRKETEELGWTETSEECRHPWHAGNKEKISLEVNRLNVGYPCK